MSTVRRLLNVIYPIEQAMAEQVGCLADLPDHALVTISISKESAVALCTEVAEAIIETDPTLDKEAT